MLPSGNSTPIGGAQSVPTALRSNSGLSGAQSGQMPTQNGFPSLLPPHTRFNNINMLGNTPNVSSLLQQSFGNGIPNNGGAEPDPMSNVGSGMNFSSNPSSLGQPNRSNSISGQMLPDQQRSQNLDAQMFQHNQQTLGHHQQQQYQSIHGLNSAGSVKLEPQAMNDSHSQPSHQLHSLRNMGSVKLEPQQLQNIRNLPAVKMESQNSDQSLFLHQQQQQLLQMSRQSPQAAQMNYLHQQRIMQLQQQQQQQQQHQQQHQQQQQLALKSVPFQRSLSQSQFQQQNLPVRSNVRPAYEPGMCARRITRYMYEQQHRPEDNNIEFWRKFVSEFFAPNAKKKWCVSLYGSGRQTTGVFPQDVWQCEICNRKPGRGFEATAEVLPRLFKIKYESGTLEELLYVDMPREYQNNSGQIVLDYAKAIQESVFDQLRVVRDGQLRIVFSSDLKISSWEFCARRHEELIPRRLLIPQVSQLGAVAQKYQAATQNASSSMSVPELQNNCNMFVASARQLAKALEVPLVNDLGYTKRYVRCLQISEVVNSMKDLIDYSAETNTGPMESLAKFPRRTKSTAREEANLLLQQQQQQQQQQQTVGINSSNNNHSSPLHNPMQIASTNNGPNVNNPLNASTTSSSSTIAGLIHQNSMNFRHQNPMTNNLSGSFIGNGIQVASPNSLCTLPQNPSPFQSSTPSTSNNNTIQVSQSEHDGNDSQSSTVQKIIQEMRMSPQMNGSNGMLSPANAGNGEMKNVNGMLSRSNTNGLNGGNGFVGSGFAQTAMLNGIRAAMGNNTMSMNGRMGMNTMAREQNMNQQQGLGDQFLSGPGNGFNNLQFDWKPSP